MTSCDDCHGVLARLDEAGLTAVERGAMTTHLAGCAGCRAELAAQRAVAAALQGRPASPVSSAFASSLAARLDRTAGWIGLADWRLWTLRLAPVAAALVTAAWLLTAPAAEPYPPSLDDWASASIGTSSTAALIWDDRVTSDVLLEGLLDGDGVVSPEASGGR